jgi:steroid 5-alpha reductase family enzyme
MNIGATIGWCALIAFGYMTSLFVIAMIRKDNSVADIAWGPGFIVLTWSALLMNWSFGATQILVACLVTIWGLRLGIRIFRRNRGKGEDPRYEKWRRDWGKHFVLRSYMQVFILQGVILLLNLTPVMIIMSDAKKALTWPAYVGLAIWCIGFAFEATGDYELDRFLADPANRGTIIDVGLWRYTRHPNYFGESTMWWGIFFIALSVPWGWIGVIGPIVITSMILFVSGIPMTEKLMEKTPGWDDYKKRTSAFIPWFPRKTAG